VKHSTTLIVIASIAAVLFATALAVAVNLGILTVAENSNVGQLTTLALSEAAAAPGEASPTPEATAAPSAPVKPRRQTQDYTVKKAGRVRIASSHRAVRFVDAAPRSGWKWELGQRWDRRLTVTFTKGAESYTFIALLGAGGRVTARVEHSVKRPASSTTNGTSGWTPAPAPASTPVPVAPAPATPVPVTPTPTATDHGGGHDDDRPADD
jgi:hypothetical protein